MGKSQSRTSSHSYDRTQSLDELEIEAEDSSKNVSAASVAGSMVIQTVRETAPCRPDDMSIAVAGVGKNQDIGSTLKMVTQQERHLQETVELEKTEIQTPDTSLAKCLPTEEILSTGKLTVV